MGRFTYLLWLTVFVWIPKALLYFKFPKLFREHKKTLFFVATNSVLFAVLWDYLAVRNGVWSFSSTLTLKPRLVGLPLEEFFFYISISALVAVVTLLVNKTYEH